MDRDAEIRQKDLVLFLAVVHAKSYPEREIFELSLLNFFLANQ